MADTKAAQVVAVAKPAKVKRSHEQTAAAKRSNFIRLANRRVTNTLKRLEGIGHLSGPAYSYTADDVKKIFSALQDALDLVRGRFEVKDVAGKKGFTL